MSPRVTPFRWRGWVSLTPVCAAMLVMGSQIAHADPMRDCDQLDDPPLAIRACSRLIAAVLGTTTLHNKRGIAHFRNGDTDLAIADYAEAIRLDPKNPEPYYNRGRALLSKSEYSRAIADFSLVLARHPKQALARNGRAWALFKMGKLPTALEDADQAIAADATYAAAYDTRAHIYEALNRRDQAIADFRRALALDPRNPLVHITREGLARLGATP